MNPSRSVLGEAIELESAVINEDLNLADLNLQSALERGGPIVAIGGGDSSVWRAVRTG